VSFFKEQFVAKDVHFIKRFPVSWHIYQSQTVFFLQNICGNENGAYSWDMFILRAESLINGIAFLNAVNCHATSTTHNRYARVKPGAL